MKVVKNTEREYAKALRKIARHAASIVDLYADGAVIANPTGMQAALIKYAEELAPFANRTASKMIAATQKSIDRAIKSQSKTMSAKLREVLQSQTGRVAIDLHRAQVDLIKSLPIDAGTRAQNLAMEAVTGGRRPAEIAAEIARTGEVTQSRALLIARTESSKASAVLTEARAKSVGATHYI